METVQNRDIPEARKPEIRECHLNFDMDIVMPNYMYTIKNMGKGRRYATFEDENTLQEENTP